MNNHTTSFSEPQIFKPQDKDQPLDTVSQILWNQYHGELAFFVASWDGTVRHYKLVMQGNSAEINLIQKSFFKHPVLSIDISSDNILFAGLATGEVVKTKMETNEITKLGSHDAPICGVFYIQ